MAQTDPSSSLNGITPNIFFKSDIRKFVETPKVKGEFKAMVKNMTLLAEGAKGNRKLTSAQISAAVNWLDAHGVNGFLNDMKDAHVNGTLPLGKQSAHFWSMAPEGKEDFGSIQGFWKQVEDFDEDLKVWESVSAPPKATRAKTTQHCLTKSLSTLLRD